LRADGAVAPITESGVLFSPPAGQRANTTGFLDYVFAPGGTLQRAFVRQGFGQFSTQDRNRYETAARLQNIWGAHTFKYGVELYRNIYDITQLPNGPILTFGNPLGLSMDTPDNNEVDGFTVGNSFSVCTTRVMGGVNTIVCPAAAAAARVAQLVAAGAVPGFTASRNAPITEAESSNNPFLIRLGTRLAARHSPPKHTRTSRASTSRMTTRSVATCKFQQACVGTSNSLMVMEAGPI
jgi:hypothetical protein